MPTHRKWTEVDVAQATSMRRAGVSFNDIAGEMGSDYNAIVRLCKKHNIETTTEMRSLAASRNGQSRASTTSVRKRRVCLRCDRSFISHGAGHRRCGDCARVVADQDTPYAI